MTVTTPANWYANFGNGSSTGYYAVALWTLNTAYTVGQIVRQKTNPGAASLRCFICIVAGTSSNTTEPTWNTGKGTKTTDTAPLVWMECSGNPALNADLTSTPLSSQNRSGGQSLGNIITNNAQTYYFICTTSGPTGAGEPTFVLSAGSTTVDSSCTWTCLGAVSVFTGTWAAPIATLQASNGWPPVNGAGTLYVSSAHAETSGGVTITLGGAVTNIPEPVICVANAGSFPPVAANITTGASVTTTANGSLTLNGCVEYTGIAFSCGTGLVANTFTFGSNSSASFVRLKNCAVSLPPSGATTISVLSTTEWYNTTVTFGSSASQLISLTGCSFLWRDTASALAASTWPTNLFSAAAGSAPSTMFIEGVDLSAFAGTNLIVSNNIAARSVFSQCKLPSAAAVASTGFTSQDCGVLDLVNCDTAGTTYDSARYGASCRQVVGTDVIATGGASDGTTGYAWRIETASGQSWVKSFECPPMAIWNATTGANVTVTIQGAYVGTAPPNNSQIWLDVVYFGTSSSTLSTRNTTTIATPLTSVTPWSASSTLWGSAAAARQNSHAYVLGNTIGVSSGSSIVRAFYCTTAGTSNGSLPVAYASAVDGTQVTDGTAVFTAVERFALTTTLSTPQPQSAGYLRCYVKTGLASAVFYVDPNPILS